MTTLHRLLLRPLLLVLALAVLGAAASADQEDLRYPRNLAWRLVTEQEVREISGCPQALGREEQDAPALFPAPQAPLGGIEAAIDREPVLLQPQTQWDVAPFPSLEPPPPAGLPEEALRKWKERVAPQGPAPEVFAEVSTDVVEAPSAALRPRATAMGEQFLAPATELPRPFSLRRYHTKDRGFFQVAVYGGASGLTAERDFRTLRAAAPNRRPVPGVGEAAFLALVPRPPAPAPAPAPDTAFESIAPLGEKRLDLVDEGLIKAKSAPSFQSIPVDLGLPEGLHKEHEEPVAAEDPLDKADPEPFGGAVAPGESGTQVLVAFFPSKRLVLELAMDDRIGDSQALVRLALLVQARLLQRW